MNQDNKYPDLTYPEAYKIQMIALSFRKDPEYLRNSPYTDPTKQALEQILNPTKSVDMSDGLVADTVAELDMEAETQYLYNKTKEMMSSTKDLKDNISLVKNAQDLLTKLLEMNERAKNLRYVKDLEKVVVETTKEMTAEQKEKIIQILSRNQKSTNQNAPVGE